MKNWSWRMRYLSLLVASGALFALNGCSLSDRQLGAIWQSVITTGLNTVVTNILTSAAGTTGA